MDDLSKNYDTIESAIKKNIDAISDLVEQTENVKSLIDQIAPKKTDAKTTEIKQQLDDEIYKMRDAIVTLINQTSRLVKAYKQVI